MKKILCCISVIMIIGLIPFGFSHAKPMDMNYAVNGTAQNVKVIGLMPSTSDKDSLDVTFLSKQWINQNFINVLTGTIALTMTITTSIIYKKEIPFLRNVNKK